MPRRKYGRLRKTIPPTKPDKCRYCTQGWKCPIHDEKESKAAYDAAEKKRKKKTRRTKKRERTRSS